MSRKKMSRADRKLLKRHGFGKQFGAEGEFLVATHHAQVDARPEGYAVRADIEHGKRTRRRVRRERWRRFWRGLFLCGAAGPSSRKGRTPFRYAEAPALPSPRGSAVAGRSYAPTVCVLVGLVVLLVAIVWLLE